MALPSRLPTLFSLAGALSVLGLFGLLLGCSPRSAEEVAADHARVVGTWEYKTDGIRALQHGTFQITVHDGKLVGRFQDRWSGRVEAEVDIRGTFMELKLDRLRITGKLEDGRFEGSVRDPLWDVSHSLAQDQSKGHLVARRIHSKSTMDEVTEFGCAPLLRESSYACPALGSK